MSVIGKDIFDPVLCRYSTNCSLPKMRSFRIVIIEKAAVVKKDGRLFPEAGFIDI